MQMSLFGQLEERVHSLVEKLKRLREDNQRLRDDLSAVKCDFEEQVELQNTLEHRSQELQLLEKERLNLRDQIAFLQNAMQNKDKDWKNRYETMRHDYEDQLSANQERINSLELKLKVLQIDADQASSVWEEQKKQLIESEAQLFEQNKKIQDLENELFFTHQSKAECEKEALEKEVAMQSEFEAKLAQENERFRIEYALLGRQHEQNLSDLTQALNQQKERLREEKDVAVEKMERLIEQNKAYRSLLEQSTHDIQSILSDLSKSFMEAESVSHEGEEIK